MRLADAAAPFPASVEVTALVVLFCVAVVVPVTLTAKLQEAPPASVAPERLTLLELASAVIVPLPQFPVRPLGDDTVSPDGNASVKPTPLRDVAAFGLLRLKVSDVVPFKGTLADPKTLAIVGGDATGGGVPDPDEPPPPQAAFENNAARTLRKSDAERIFFQNFKLLFAPVYFYFCSGWSLSGISSPCGLGRMFIWR
jgi:hypothetical protein